MIRDIRYALRGMRHNPAFTITAVAALALGIGANTAIFTVVRAVLLDPLPYRNPDQLVYLSMSDPQRNVQEAQLSLLRFDELRAAARSFVSLGAYGANPENATLSGADEPEALRAARVSANFLAVVGVQPLVGRGFLPEEDVTGGPAVAMISGGLWKRRFAGDPGITGKVALLDAVPYTIVGVLPAGFQFPFPNADVWFPRPSEWTALPARYWGVPLLKGFGRVKRGVSLPEVRAEMKLLSQHYNAAHPGIDRGSIQAVWLKDRLVQNVRPLLQILFGAVGFVLLIACANVASLLMARSASRSREFALRAALGAGGGRLAGQLLVESVALALAGGALGVGLAQWSLSAWQRLGGLGMIGNPNALSLRLDGVILVFTLTVSIATGVLFGLFPSLQLSRPELADVLRESGVSAGRGLSGKRGSFGFSPRALLVVGQVALSVVLLIGAALLMRSFLRLNSVDPGFQASHVLTAKMALPLARYDTPRKRSAFFDSIIGRLEAIPGVAKATLVSSLPTTRWIRTNISQVQGQAPPDEHDAASYAVVQSIAPGYFETLRIPLRRGREFRARDNVGGAPPVIIVNEALARRLWRDYPRGVDPVGQHIGEAFDKAVGWLEVVGVSADIHEGGLAEVPTPEMYVPYAIHPPQSAYLAVRSFGDPLDLVNAVRRQLSTVDRDQSISETRSMEAVLDESMGNRRWILWLLTGFAGIALLLAMVGIYGTIAWSVAQRTQELGIRRALGAQQSDILRLILGEGLGLTLAGTIVGIGGALALTRLMKGFLFQISPTDPAAFVGIAAVFLLVGAAASYIPARRALQIDPTAALRV